MSNIEKRFNHLKKQKRKAFIAFITAGYPDLKTTEELVLELDKRRVDIVELGVPFSDPMADGVIIQEASQKALKAGTTLPKILDLVTKIRTKSTIPICLMTYYNPIFCFGEERFAKAASLSGVDGVIIPDLPPEEAKIFFSAAYRHGLDVISFIAPTTSLARMKHIASKARGFIYYVSLTGVTGIRQQLPSSLVDNIKRIKRYTAKPVCVGFGVSNAQQVKMINRFADGVIVGSAIVKKIKESVAKPDLVKRVGNFVSGLIP